MDFQKITDQIQKQPEEIKKMIFSEKTFSQLEDIAVSKKLTEEQFLILNDETFYALVNIKPKSLLQDSLVKAGFDKDLASSISKEIEQKIFSKLDKATGETVAAPNNNKNIVKSILNFIKNKDQKRPEYLATAPVELAEAVTDNTWQQRLKEIAKKYSLNPAQTDMLAETVLSIILGFGKEELLADTIVSGLNISKLLASSITDELKARVLEYVRKLTEETNKKKTGPQKPQLPEIAPEIMPMVEKNQKVKVNPPPKVAPKPELKKNLADAIAQAKPTPKPTPAVKPPEIKPEPVQRPVPVPRFTAVKIEEEIPEQKPITPVKPPEIKVETKPEIKPEPIKKAYAADPYREPIE